MYWFRDRFSASIRCKPTFLKQKGAKHQSRDSMSVLQTIHRHFESILLDGGLRMKDFCMDVNLCSEKFAWESFRHTLRCNNAFYLAAVAELHCQAMQAIT